MLRNIFWLGRAPVARWQQGLRKGRRIWGCILTMERVLTRYIFVKAANHGRILDALTTNIGSLSLVDLATSCSGSGAKAESVSFLPLTRQQDPDNGRWNLINGGSSGLRTALASPSSPYASPFLQLTFSFCKTFISDTVTLERRMALVNIKHLRLSQLHALRFSVQMSQLKALVVMLRKCGLPDSVKELVVEIRYSLSFFLSMRPCGHAAPLLCIRSWARLKPTQC